MDQSTKKKLATVGVAAILVFSSLPPTQVFAARTTQQIESEIKETRNELSKVEQELARLEDAIKENRKILNETEKNIESTENEIQQLNKEKEEIEERMAKREEIIKKRMATMQKMGGTLGYLDVILGATDFEDFISRVSSLATIAKADQTLLEEQKADAEVVQEKVTAAETKLAELNDMKAELQEIEAVIAAQKAETEKIKEQLKDKEGRLLAEKEAREREERARRMQAQLQSRVAQSQVAGAQVTQSQVAGASSKQNSHTYSKPSVSGSKAVQIVTSVGYPFIGKSVYVFGAADPVNGRFDCSGFVQWAFAQAGIAVGRSTSSLASTGTKISKSDLRPGDLVFFNTYKRNGHVGIYIGGGKFIGSQSSTGVAIANMNDSYWGPRFSQARRVIN
ncbi:MAG: NlpC/P60 family protein [Caldibacillus sp.]